MAVEGAFGEIFERVFEKGCEGVFEGGCEGVFRRMRRGLPEDFREVVLERFPGGCLRRRLRRVLPEGVAKGSSGGCCEGVFRRISERGGYDRWIQSGRLRFIGWIGLR